MGIEDKKPYQPTEEEIKKGEDMMTDEQKYFSEHIREPLSKWKHTDLLPGWKMEILENGDIHCINSAGGWGDRENIVSPEKALEMAREAIEGSNREIKQAEWEIERIKQIRDRQYILEKKLLNLIQNPEDSK